MSNATTLQPADMSNTTTLQPKGIGGWLILFAIGSVVAPVKVIAGVLDEMTAPGMAQAFQNYPVMMDGLLAIDVAFVLLVLVTSWAFFTKKAIWPTLYFAVFSAALVVPFLAMGWMAMLTPLPGAKVFDVYAEAIAQGIGAAIGGALWFWYLKTSVRVRNTFVY